MYETIADSYPPARSRLLKLPILTEEQKQALFEREDHGIQPAPLLRFSTYEEWRKRQSRSTHNQGFFISAESDQSIFAVFREFQCFQRFQILYPDLLAEVIARVEEYQTDFSKSGKPLSEDTDRLLREAYEKMASLTDVSDEGLNMEGRVPEGEIDPEYLMV